MKLEHYPLTKLKKEILTIVQKHMNLNGYRVFFFGSRVTGDSQEISDIDIGIEGSNPVPSNALWRIKDDIDHLPILYKIDFVDFARVSEDFRKFAKQKIEFIN